MTATTIRTLAVGAAVFSLHAAAQGLVVCTHGALERSVEVVYETPGEPVPCEVRYAKSDAVTSPWRAEREEGYCERQAVGLIQRLTDAGWSCQASSTDGSPAAPAAEPEAASAADVAADSVAPETDSVVPEPDAVPDAVVPEATPE